MTRRDDAASLRHMLNHAREAVDMARDRQREELKQNRMLELALVRLVEIVGEAATRVSDACQQRHAAVPWLQARGMRNRLIHGYDKIDLDVLWDTLGEDLPPLIAELERIVADEGG